MAVKDIRTLSSFLLDFLGTWLIFRKKVRFIFGNFLFTRSPHSFLANYDKNCVILHEEVREAVESNRI